MGWHSETRLHELTVNYLMFKFLNSVISENVQVSEMHVGFPQSMVSEANSMT